MGGRKEGVMLRLPAATLAAIDDWRALQADAPTRPEAIRRLVAKALGRA